MVYYFNLGSAAYAHLRERQVLKERSRSIILQEARPLLTQYFKLTHLLKLHSFVKFYSV